jgi:uncharacterized membrane protein
MKEHDKAFQVELLISELLRWGVLVSLVLLALGTVLCFVQGTDYGQAGGNAADLHRLITREDCFPLSVSWFFDGLVRFQGQAIIVTGLALLIATPVLRVFVSIFAYVAEKDRTYVVITTIVFLFLVVSFVLGKAG